MASCLTPFSFCTILFDPGEGTICVPLKELLQAGIGTRLVQWRNFFWQINQRVTLNHIYQGKNGISSYISQTSSSINKQISSFTGQKWFLYHQNLVPRSGYIKTRCFFQKWFTIECASLTIQIQMVLHFSNFVI